MTEMPSLHHLRVGGWEVDVAGHALRRDGVEVHVEPRVMQVLLRLVEGAPGVVSRRTLRADVWGDDYVSDDAVSATVIKLRKAFDDDPRNPHVIQTVPKSGYRLVAAVERGDTAPVGDGPRPANPAPAHSGTRVATLVRVIVDIESPADRPMDPEAWLAAMRGAVAVVTDTVTRHGGWLREESTGLLGVFGAPAAQEHHVERALRAALELRERSVTSGLGAGVVLRQGVASGPVVAASDRPDALGVYGATARVSALLAEAAKPHDVLVEAPALQLRDATVVVDPEARTVPGVPRPVHRLISVEHHAGVWETRQRLGLTRLHGRVEEMAALQAALERASSGRGQVVSVTGEPGVGKSRLLFELLNCAREAGYVTWEGDASPLDQHSPYFAWARLLGAAPERLERARAAPGADHAALDSVLHPDRSDAEWAATDPEVRQARAASAVVDALAPDAGVHVIALEDVHWCDQASRTLLDGVVSRIARRPVLLVVTRRPEGPDVVQAAHVTSLWLHGLVPAAAAAMLDELVGVDGSLDAWKTDVLAGAGGTPLFLEECVRFAEDQGTLVAAATGYRLDVTPVAGRRAVDGDGTPVRPAVPASVQALIAERIDQLSDAERRVVSAAAVLGRETPEPVVAAVAALAEAEWVRARDRLHSGELLYETTSGGRRRLVFKHALTRDVAYRGIPAEERHELHRRAAEELAALTEATPEVLAWHLQEAGRAPEAVVRWRRAADAAARAGAFEDALVHLDRAAELLSGLASDDDRDSAELEIQLARGAALVQTVGPTDEAVEGCYTRAGELAGSVGSAEQRFTAVWGAWFVHLMRGDLGKEREFGARIAELATVFDDDDALSLEAHHVQWSGLTLAGRPREAAAHSEVGITRYDRGRHHWLTFSYGGHDPGVCALNLNAMARLVTADVPLARERSHAALQLADELGHAYSILEATQSQLVLALLDRDPDTLEEVSGRLVQLVEDGRLPEVARGYADGFLGAAAAFRGDHAAAVARMRAAAPVWSEFWGAWCFPLDTVHVEVLDAAGEPEEAMAHVQRTLAWADASGGSWWSADLHRLHADLARRQGADLSQVTAELRDAAELAAAQGALLLQLRACTTWALLAGETAGAGEACRRLRAVVAEVPAQEPFADLRRAHEVLADHPAG